MCMHVCMYVRMYVCISMCMYVCVSVSVRLSVCWSLQVPERFGSPLEVLLFFFFCYLDLSSGFVIFALKVGLKGLMRVTTASSR